MGIEDGAGLVGSSGWGYVVVWECIAEMVEIGGVTDSGVVVCDGVEIVIVRCCWYA